MIVGDSARLPECDAAEGHSSGIQERHACSASRFRRDSRRMIFRPRGCSDSRNWSRRAGSRRNCGRFETSIRDSNTGFARGMFHTGLQMVTGGRGLRNRYLNAPGHTRMRQLEDYYGSQRAASEPPFDRKLTFDKLTDVYTLPERNTMKTSPCISIVLQPDICHPRCTIGIWQSLPVFLSCRCL